MITPRTMIDFISAEPFPPFRIHMASGRTFDIGHPEMIKVGRSSMTVYMRPEHGPEQAERWQKVSLTLVKSMELLDAKAGAGSH